MKHYAPVGFSLLVTGLILMTPVGFSQTTPSEPDVGIKLINPAALGLDSSASAQTGTGLSFTVGSAGGSEITVEIVTEEVSIDSQGTLERFLSENGIRPDANAQSFVYYLNPDLASIREIRKSTKLQLPIFRAPSFDRELPKQPIIAVVMDAKLKAGLQESVSNYRNTVKKRRNDFVPQVVNYLTSIGLNLDKFYADRVPASHDMLGQVNQDVVTLNSILGRYSRKSRSFFSKGPKLDLKAEDYRQLNLVDVDLRDKIEAATTSNPQVKVVAKTFDNKGGEVSHFIVCYAAIAEYEKDRCDRSFSEQSSPTNEQSLSAATYQFWAIKPGTVTPVSDVRPILVRWQDGKPINVHLTIK